MDCDPATGRNLICVTSEMIEAGASEIAAHGVDDSCSATAWAVFAVMARLAGFVVEET
jgi:hypothetical protein